MLQPKGGAGGRSSDLIWTLRYSLINIESVCTTFRNTSCKLLFRVNPSNFVYENAHVKPWLFGFGAIKLITKLYDV